MDMQLCSSFALWLCIHRANSRFAPSQWETSLRSNVVSHCLGASQEAALYTYMRVTWCDLAGCVDCSAADWRAVVGNRPANDLSLRQVRNCVVRIFRAFLANTIMQMYWQPLSPISPSFCAMLPWHRNALYITGPLWGESTGERLIPLKRASGVGFWCILCCWRAQAVNTVEMIWDVLAYTWRHCNKKTGIFLVTLAKPCLVIAYVLVQVNSDY